MVRWAIRTLFIFVLGYVNKTPRFGDGGESKLHSRNK